MEPSQIIPHLQQQLGFNAEVFKQGTLYYQHAVEAKLDKKHNPLVVACASLYVYCRRHGMNITMTHICNIIPITREELMNAYEDVRRIV